MKFKSTLFAALFLSSMSNVAFASDHNQYVTLGLGFGDVEVDASVKGNDGENYGSDSVTFDQTTLNGAYGYHFNKYFAVEAKLNVAVTDEDDLKATTIGAYFKAGYPFSDVVEVYALAGYARTNFSVGDFEDDDYTNENGFSYGVEMNFNISDRWGVGVNYMSYYSDSEKYSDSFANVKSDIDFSTVSVYAKYRF